MARKGNFGRAPRQAPNLTNTLVAIAREYQNQRSENIMSAWMKGGIFEGKKATDELVLAFWKKRFEGVSKDDPLYDTYKNAHTQLDYQIHESKMTAKYAQKQASDAEMVAFYLGWAKKVPKNSEFYRVLQRDAGQYMRNNKANNEAERRRREEEAYQRAQNASFEKNEQAGEYLTNVFRRMAQSGNADAGILAPISAPGSGSDFTDFDVNDPDAMLKLIAVLAPEGTAPFVSPTSGAVVVEGTGEFGKGDGTVIFHDDDGKPVTSKDILTNIAKYSPSFKPGAPVDLDLLTGLMDQQVQGLNERIERARKTGHMQDVAELTKKKEYVAMLNRTVGAMPVQTAYKELRRDYDAILADKSASPAAVLKAREDYVTGLLKLSKDERIATNDNFRARLVSEANGDTGVPTLNESFTGLQTGAFDETTAKDSAENMAVVEHLQMQMDAVRSGEAVWTYGTDGKPAAGGKEIIAATREQVQSAGMNMTTVMVPDPRGGNPLPMAVVAKPVYAKATDPNGNLLTRSDNNPVAYAYDIPNGGRTTTIYGFTVKDGSMRYSSDPPWDERIKPTEGDGGKRLEIDLSSYAQPVINGVELKKDGTPKKPDQDFGNGFKLVGGKMQFDPQDAAWNTDSRTGIGEPDPFYDFHSLTLATLKESSDGMNILSNLDKNAPFKAQLEQDSYTGAGYARDPKTGGWVPTQAADPNKLQTYNMQNNMVSISKNLDEVAMEARKMWNRQNTGSMMPTKTQWGGGTNADGFRPLATDEIKSTLLGAALGGAFVAGTNNLDRAKFAKGAGGGFEVRAVAPIKVPGVETAIKSITNINKDKPVAQTASYQTPSGGGLAGTGVPSGGTTQQKPLTAHQKEREYGY